MSAFREMPRRSLDPPPRRVAPRAAFCVLFGSYPSRIGWFFLVFGLVGLRAAAIQARENSWFQGPLGERVGHVTGSYEMRSGKHQTPTGQYAIDFVYAAENDGPETSSGRSYTRDPSQIPGDGAEVVVEVPLWHREVGRIQGLSPHSSETPSFLLLVPFAALGAIGFGFFRGRRQLRLLLDSRLTPASLDRIDEPGFFERKKGHTLYFVYDDHRDVARSLILRTTTPGRLQRAELTIAHDDSDPPRAVLLQALPGTPRLGEDQVFRDRLEGLDLLLSLIVPVAGMLASLAAVVVAVCTLAL